jgi:predicted metal-dependent phosphoesterase TrpH
MLRSFKVDLHVHTCLSPCADNRMVPRTIVERARQVGLDAVGICDHNAAANVRAVREAGNEAGIGVLAGTEVTTAEEIHLLALFDSEEKLLKFAALVSNHLSGSNDPELFGDQIVVDKNGEPTALEERLLIGATDLGISRTVEEIHRLEGLAIASHVDRHTFSILSQLGFIPAELDLDGVELSQHAGPEEQYELRSLPVVRSSDAHFPEVMGSAFTSFFIEEATVAELGMALAARDGRKILRVWA